MRSSSRDVAGKFVQHIPRTNELAQGWLRELLLEHLALLIDDECRRAVDRARRARKRARK